MYGYETNKNILPGSRGEKGKLRGRCKRLPLFCVSILVMVLVLSCLAVQVQADIMYEVLVTLTVTPDSVPTLPASVTLRGRVTDYYTGAGIQAPAVSFWYPLLIDYAPVDSDGYYSYVWTLPEEMQSGIYTIKAYVTYEGGSNQYDQVNDPEVQLTVGTFWTITASAGANGTISPSGEVSVGDGEDQTFIITPDTGYIVADVLVDGASIGAVTTYTSTSVTANHTVAASFTANLEPPAAPTSPVVDDDNDTFGWTNGSGFNDPSDYEYTKNGGTIWNTCTANPQTGFDGDITAEEVRVRVKADPVTGRPAGAELQATTDFTANMAETDATAPAVTDGAITTSSITGTGVTLSWNKATDNVSVQGALQYLVCRSNSNTIDTVENIESNGTAIGSYAADINTKEITGLPGSATYYFNVIVKDEAGNKTAYTMKAVTTEAALLPIMGGAVIISGEAKYGETLTADTSGITYNPETAADVPAYQWKRGEVDITGAIDSTYILGEADIGQTITVTVTADGVHATGSVTSAASMEVGDEVKAEGVTKVCLANYSGSEPPPAFAAYYPRTVNVTGAGLDLLLKMNKAGTAYYEVCDAGAAAPEAEDLRDSGNQAQMAVTSAETMIIGLNYPEGVAVDRDGNIYVADTNNNRVRKYDPEGHYLREWTGFSQPRGVAVDRDGNIYVADTMNHLIKKYGVDGDFILQWGGEGTSNGQFKRTRGVAVDNDGHVYVADEQNHRIQKFTADGGFITKWGSYSTTGDGQFNNPTGVAVDSCNGNVYVADYNNHRIQKFTADGGFITKWGSYGGGNGQFYNPAGIVVDQDGNVYVAEYRNHRVQKFAEDGTFLAKWGKADCSYGSGEEEFNGSNGLAMDGAGNIYVTDRTNNRIQKLCYKGSASIIGLAVGQSYDIYVAAADEDGCLQAEPVKVAVTTDAAPAFAAGYPITANATPTGLDLLVKMNEEGTAYYWVYDAGTDAPGSTWLKNNGEIVEIAQTSAETFIISLSNPSGVAVDDAGDIYVADTNNKRVRKYDPEGNQLFEWTGFNDPQGIAVDNAGSIYVADNGSNPVIKKYGADGGFICEWGGKGTGDGQFDEIRGVAADSAGYVYAVQWNNGCVQKFTAAGEFVTKWGSYGDGNGQFKNPTGVAVDNAGNVYVADYWNHRVQKFTSLGQYLAKWGSNGTGNGQFYKPSGIAVDKDGNICVADYGNHRVQKFDKNGTFLAKWGKADCTAGSGEEEFNGSYGLAADETGNVYAADRANNRIQKLAYKGGGSITGLDAGQSYDIYVAAEDVRGNLQAEPVKLTVTLESLDVATPVASPAAGTVIIGTQVTLSCATTGAVIHYTTDGSEPTSGSSVYTNPIPVNTSMIINAVAVKTGMEDSEIMTAAYTAVAGDEVHVSPVGDDANDGYSWGTAKRTVRTGIDTVIAGGTVYLADGIYEGENNRNITIGKNVAIQGQTKDGAIIDGGSAAQIFAVGSGRNVAIRSVTIRNGAAAYGAIANSGNLTVDDCILKDNTATIEGGAVRNAGTLTVNGSSFLNNTAPGTTSGSGGAIYSEGALTINDSVFTGNTAKYGGAIRSWQPTGVNNSVFNGNNAWYSDGCGGAIHNSSELTLNGCVFASNQATNGGAVYNEYNRILTVTGSTFRDNSSFYNGGAISNNGTATVRFCRLIGNTYGSTPQDIYRGNYSTGPVDAEYNWWGSNASPSARVGGSITVSKWLVLTVTTAPDAIFTDETAAVTADLRHDQDGGYHDPSGGHVPDGIAVAFGTSLGSLAPAEGATAGGQAASAFTASAVGTANVTAIVDNQTVSTQIAVQPEYCTLTYTAGTHGSIIGTSPQTVGYGGSGTQVTAVPDSGYHFIEWSDGVATASRTDTNVTGDISVMANFAQNIALVITAHSKTKTYGAGDPVLTYEITEGKLKEGDEITGALEREAGNDAGTYAILQGTLTADPRYDIIFVAGTLTINKAPLTVTANDKEKAYGGTDPELTYTVSGELFYGDTASVVSEVVLSTATGAAATAGEHSITASGGTANNYDINHVEGTLTVTKASLTVTADDKSKVYDGEFYSQFTITCEGFVYGENEDNLDGELIFSGDATTEVNAGTYEIIPGGLTSGNYNITFIPGQLEITKRVLNVTAEAKSKNYGDSDPAFTYQITSGSLVGSDALSGLLTRVAGENVGVYEIQQGDLTAGSNYDLTYIAAMLEITPRGLTVTADDKSKVYDGESYSQFTITCEGFVYGENEDNLDGELIFSGDATTEVNAGTYEIIPGGLTSGNYNITFYNGWLVIAPPPAPAAPTCPVVDDANNIFGWTYVPGFDHISDYEYSVNSGATWNSCTANPQLVGNNAYVAGAVQVRVKADNTTARPAGDVLVSHKPYTVTYYSDDSDSTPSNPPPTDNTSTTIISSTTIDKQTATTPTGQTIETFTVQAEASAQIEEAKAEGKTSVQFNVDSSLTSVTGVNIPAAVLESAADLNVSISTPNATLELPATLVNALAEAGKDLSLTIARGSVPTQPVDATVLGIPTIINTGIVGTTQVTIPLSGIAIPANLQEREAFLASLSVFTLHSDGEQQLITGEIIYNASGNPVGISFPVDKFSTFAIVKLSKKTVTLTVDRDSAAINGVPYTLDASPFIDTKANRTLAPLRFISEALGAKVEWLPATCQVRIKDGAKEIILSIDTNDGLINGEIMQIDCAPVIVPPGRTFLPLRFVSETLGAEVMYDDSTSQISIIKEYGL